MRGSVSWQLHSINRHLAWATAVSCGITAAAQPLPPAATPTQPSPWTPLFSLATGGGYKDNLLLSSVNQQESAFLHSNLEFILAPSAQNPHRIEFYASFEDRHYLQSVDVEKEQLGFSQLSWTHSLNQNNQVQLILEYLYQDQVVDVSTTERTLDVVQLRGHSLWISPSFRMEAEEGPWWMELHFPASPQWYERPLDDYVEFGPKLIAGYSYGFGSDLQARYEFIERQYAQDPSLDANGSPIPGSTRAFEQNRVELAWRQYWDSPRAWRTTARLFYKLNSDNGGGFFDYSRYGARLELRYRTRFIEASAEGAYSTYRYEEQVASPTNPDLRQRDETSVRVRLEKPFTSFLRAYAEFETEDISGNDPLDNYVVHTAWGGLLWEF